MCGRYSFVITPSMVTYFTDMGLDPPTGSLFNIAPTESVPIILGAKGHRECHLARWWLTPSWSSGPDTKYSMFNARAENLESSRAYKGAFHHKRCIIPASSFIEWKAEDNGKQPYEILRQDNQPISFAGLWDCWNDELISWSIVTTNSAPSMAFIHKRMPVMLDTDGANQWLNTDSEPASLTHLFRSQLPFALKARPVDKAINSGKRKIATVAVGDDRLLTQ